MAKAQKFGTFGGVFTPSILTILGVIMYLRLPWIAGQAGLFVTLSIIIIAHIISATTGLSVASIATDKKVKTGGTYYMVSRSLGLPIGGTLGLALFVGLSLSVSLYLIGFAESFLDYWELEKNLNTIRITGTIALLTVTTITFISTSLAIKSQYFIMTAIFLSLVSILFGRHDYAPEVPQLNSIENAAPFMLLFGIFFPAVTGFEAGVSMSGDLKDPKKSLPIGTIMAIVVGLLVYVGLAFFFAYTVSADLLVNDPQALFKISWIPELVIAGIWGATVSSALGSILGAPRILQATAIDKITPKFFAKGVGASNEPRNALLLTFIIAEAGILIGELNVIARIVSMFFITTYGFLNLSCTIESWASSDFRPDFKIPRLVSIVGALACFIVMIQLDFVAFVGATVLLGLVFLYLKRKELTLDSGDTWGSVWISLVRTGLGRLSRNPQNVRNWRPNIILFSGGIARSYLLEIGKALVGKLGILSNFELEEDVSASSLLDRPERHETREHLQHEGIFVRKHVCKDIYEGIDAIASTYGFAGIEPNTVLMGWGRNTRDPEKYAWLLKKFYALNYNTIFLSYDKERGFGQKQRIDIWWRGADNNLPFALALAKFITSDNEWRSADIRILVVTEQSALIGIIRNDLHQILEEYRIGATAKVINNAVEKRALPEIITAESKTADLTILGLAENIYRNPDTYIQKINELTDKLGSVLMIDASSFFKEVQIGIEKTSSVPTAPSLRAIALPELKLGTNKVAARHVEEADQQLQEFLTDFYETTWQPVLSANQAYWERLRGLIQYNFSSLEKQISGMDTYRSNRAIYRAHNELLFQARKLTNEYIETLRQERDIFMTGIRQHELQLQKYVQSVPPHLILVYPKEDFIIKKEDKLGTRLFKLRKKWKAALTRHAITSEVAFRNLVDFYFRSRRSLALKQTLENFGLNSTQTLARLRELVLFMNETYEKIKPQNEAAEAIRVGKNDLIDRLAQLQEQEKTAFGNYHNTLLERARRDMQGMSDALSNLEVNRLIRKKRKTQNLDKRLEEYNLSFPDMWYINLLTFTNTIYLDITVLALQNRMKVNTQKVSGEIATAVNTFLLEEINTLQTELKASLVNGKSENNYKITFNEGKEVDLHEIFQDTQEEVWEALHELPDSLEIIGTSFANAVTTGKFHEHESVAVPFQRIAEYHMDAEFISPVHQALDAFKMKLLEVSQTIKDQVNITNFNLDNIHNLSEENDIKTYNRTLLQNFLKRLEQEKEKVEKEINTLDTSMQKHLEHAFEPLGSYAIVQTSDALGSNLREREGRRALSKARRWSTRLGQGVQSQFIRLLYTRSEGVLLANKIWQTDKILKAQAYHVLSFMETISPRPEVIERLPFYYTNLFSGKSSISNEFWIGRTHELRKAGQSVKRYKNGYFGAILITGERRSGKTSLTQKIVSEYFTSDKVYKLQAPKEGSVRLDIFKESIQKASGQSIEPIDDIFTSLSTGSVWVINDLEMWWERSAEGMAVVNELMRLITLYSSRCLFIVNCNIHTYHFINALHKIEDRFIALIECEAFDAEELKDAVMLRHRSTGLKFELQQTAEDELSAWKLAQLFNRFFDYSKGNVGVTLDAWISCIRGISGGNTLNIVPPTQSGSEVLDNLDEDWIVYIVQFMLHRNFSFTKLCRVMATSEEEVNRVLSALLRAGIVTEQAVLNGQSIYTLHPYVEPHLVYKLKEQQIV